MHFEIGRLTKFEKYWHTDNKLPQKQHKLGRPNVTPLANCVAQ